MTKLRLGRVSAAALLVLVATTPVRAEVNPGDKFNKDNVDQLKPYISPGMEWCIRRGFPVTIGETKRVEWPKAFNQGEKVGITDDSFTVSALVNSGH